MDVAITIRIEQVRGGFTVAVLHLTGGDNTDNDVQGVATTPHSATLLARKLVKELLEKIEPTLGKETA